MKKTILYIAVMILLCGLVTSGVDAQLASGKKVVMIIANQNYRDEELEEPLELFRTAGVEVKIASNSISPARGMLGGTANPDMLIDDVRPADFDAVVFVGGSGSSIYWDDKRAHEIATGALKSGKVLGAICIAPVTLANAGVLKGKKATVWSSEGNRLEQKGAIYTRSGVEVDGSIVTADGPTSATKFGKAILEKLK